MDNSVNALERKRCTGCSSCLNICPKSAINMEFDSEGFAYPVIDESLCIHCGKCKNACPVLNEMARLEQQKDPAAFAAKNCDDEIRKKSSSGGIFSALADYFLAQNGYVCAASYDDKGKVFHKLTNDPAEITRMRGAKYVQSEIGGVYKGIKELLLQDKKVLFVGTPCQTAGLYAFLRKDYENLLGVDMICHGVPSPKVFEKHLKDIAGNKKIDELLFRNKEDGWRKSKFTVVTAGSTYKVSLAQDPFVAHYMQHLFTRPCCQKCAFAVLPRRSDITIGDYWGIENQHPEFNDPKGVSAVVLNNEKGELYFEKIREQLELTQSSWKSVAKGNPNYLGDNFFHVNKPDFFADFNKNKDIKLQDLIEANVNCDKNVAVLNFHWENNNYGAVLTAYALNRSIRKLGYKAYNIDYIFTTSKGYTNDFELFRQKHLPMTQRIETEEDFEHLNQYFRSFVVGSDQVWRRNSMIGCKPIYFLDFAHNDKNIFSYAASFGETSYGQNEQEKFDARLSLSRFSNISVREKTGVDIVKNEFKMKAIHVLDPVFLVDEREWEEFVLKDFAKPENPYLVHYVLEEEFRWKLAALRREIDNIREGVRIEEWLTRIKNSDFFITDSFHGVCFAILFNRQFICMNSNKSVVTRIQSLLEVFGLQNRLVTEIDNDIFEKLYTDKIDYGMVNEILEKQKTESWAFLKKALASESRCIENPAVETVLVLTKRIELLEKSVKAQKYKGKYHLYKFLHLITFNNKKIKKKYKEYKKLYKGK